MNEAVRVVERVIGFDSHPDSFTAAINAAKIAKLSQEELINILELIIEENQYEKRY